jgi:hypothetical protein
MHLFISPLMVFVIETDSFVCYKPGQKKQFAISQVGAETEEIVDHLNFFY